MEALRKLERVQRMLSFMASRGLSSSVSGDDDAGGCGSDRFLAQFLLFLVQPCDFLSKEKKYSLVSELLTKVTADVLEEVQHFVVEEVEDRLSLNADHHDISYEPFFPLSSMNNKMHANKVNVQDVPLIGFDAMRRANSTLEDFCRSYFMFHGMDKNKPQSIFKFLPILSFTESYIYQLDASNECSLHPVPQDTASLRGRHSLHPVPEDTASLKGRLGHLSHLSNEIEDGKTGMLPPDLFDPLVHLLQHQGLLTDRLQTELISGIAYWALERKLCQALSRKEKISIEDVMKAIHLKSFDYRVLNLLMYQLTGQQVNGLHMEFLSVSEFLVEISDDLYDYEDDVMNNTFNIFRMFVAIYGASVAPKMLAKCIGEAEEKYESLSKTLDPDLSVSYWRRCEEATKEGGIGSGHAYGTWNIPPVIVDEELFRLQCLNKDTSSATAIK